MKTVVIEGKMSGTGTIHDIASDLGDREIKFRKGFKYAIVLAAYYGYNIYYLARDEEQAVARSKKEREYSHAILDDEGNYYEIEQGYYEDKLKLI